MKCVLCGAKFDRRDISAWVNSSYCLSCQEYDAFSHNPEEESLEVHNLLHPNGKTLPVFYDDMK